jgi:hypothetical protein
MQTVEKIEFQRARDFSELLSDTFDFIRQNFIDLGKSILFIVGPFLLAVVIYSAIFQFNFMSPDPNILFSLTYFMGILISLALQILLYSLLLIVTAEFVLLYREKGAGGFGVEDVWQASSKDIVAVFFLNICVGIIVAFGTLLFIIPGIYLAIALSLTPIIYICDKAGFSGSFSRSGNLIRGHWWFTLGLLIVLGVIIFVLMFIFQIPTYIYVFFTMLHSGDPMSIAKPSWVLTLVTTIGSLAHFFYCIPIIALIFHYFSLVEKKEAAGLFKKVEEIETSSNEDKTQ